jgi:hypothetical protein
MREAYWELHVRGGTAPRSPVVLGRKHCAGCGRWRHVCDFGVIRGRFRARCRACHRAYMRLWTANRVGESRHVRLDIADRLALAVGTHLWDLYGDAPLIHIHDAEMAA